MSTSVHLWLISRSLRCCGCDDAENGLEAVEFARLLLPGSPRIRQPQVSKTMTGRPGSTAQASNSVIPGGDFQRAGYWRGKIFTHTLGRYAPQAGQLQPLDRSATLYDGDRCALQITHSASVFSRVSPAWLKPLPFHRLAEHLGFGSYPGVHRDEDHILPAGGLVGVDAGPALSKAACLPRIELDHDGFPPLIHFLDGKILILTMWVGSLKSTPE